MQKGLEIQPKAADRCKCGSRKIEKYKTLRYSATLVHRYYACHACGRHFKIEDDGK
jgi:DNA-directed RNA polymerase subunit RPC12/RpoP